MSEPEQLRVAYVVTAHRNPAQVVRMVRRLAVPGTAFILHVDAKSEPAVEAEIKAGLVDVERCHFLEPRPVRWGHVSLLRAVLRALGAMPDLDLDPDQTVVATGQDYPLRDPEWIATELSARADRAHVLYSALPNMEWWPNDRGGLDRLERAYVWVPRRGMIKTPLRRRIPHGWKPYGGAANLTLGRPQRQYVQRLLVEDRRAVRFFGLANTADETFFQTVLMNSPLRDSIFNDHLLFARWQEGANHPDVLGVDDLDEVLASQAFFARKFDETHDPEVLDELERRVDAVGASPPGAP